MTLSTHELTVRRGRRSLLSRVTTTLELGALTAIVGPNGAGKSTFAHCLAGDLWPEEGYVKLRGEALRELSPGALALRRAVLPQLSGLEFPFSVREVVRLGRLPHGDARQTLGLEATERALEAMELSDLADRSFVGLSGGERQRVHMARVLAQVDGIVDPWLILDEPTSALDLQHQHRLLACVRSFVDDGGGAIVVLHDLNLALRYAEHVLLFHAGVLVRAGPALEVLTAERLESVFEVRVRRHAVATDGSLLGTGPEIIRSSSG